MDLRPFDWREVMKCQSEALCQPSRRSVLLLSIVSFCVVSLRANPSRNRQSQEQSAADAQSQSPSIADAARRSREQAKNATKASKVITDDDLDRTKVKPGQQGLTVDAPAKLETPADRRRRGRGRNCARTRC